MTANNREHEGRELGRIIGRSVEKVSGPRSSMWSTDMNSNSRAIQTFVRSKIQQKRHIFAMIELLVQVLRTRGSYVTGS